MTIGGSKDKIYLFKSSGIKSNDITNLCKLLRNKYANVIVVSTLAEVELNCKLLILLLENVYFSKSEFANLSQVNMLIVTNNFKTNINYLLEQFNILIHSDSILHFNPKQTMNYFHPKELLLNSTCILNKSIRKHIKQTQLSFVYPNACTLTAHKPSIPILSSTHTCYPFNRPIAAVHVSDSVKICVMSSLQLFTNAYFERCNNTLLIQSILDYLINNAYVLDSIDANAPDINDYHLIPNVIALSDTIKPCLQSAQVGNVDNVMSHFNTDLFSFSPAKYRLVSQLYANLNIPQEPLTLIKPDFEVPLPPLKPAVFEPVMDPDDLMLIPDLDLIDLDEELADPKTQLNRLTNKCNDEDVEYYVREAGKILNISGTEELTGKQVLQAVLQQLVEWKKSSYGLQRTQMDQTGKTPISGTSVQQSD